MSPPLQDISNKIRLSANDKSQTITENTPKKYKRGCAPKKPYIPRPKRRRTEKMSSWTLPSESSTYNSPQINSDVHTGSICKPSTDMDAPNNLLSNFNLIEIEKQTYNDLGDINMICKYCGATLWELERAEKSKSPLDPDFSICCAKGKISIPYLKESPELLLKLLTKNEPRSRNFLDNIRSYNSMFAFTSIGGKVVTNMNDGHGPPQFIISGQNYHCIGSLLPEEGHLPKFAQLYIYDTENELQNRLHHFSGIGDSSIDPELVSDLIKMVDEFNRLAKVFRRVCDYVEEGNTENIALRLFRNVSVDPNTYNLPSVDEVAALIVGDFDSFDCGRDIILRTKNGRMQRIYENHSSFLPLQYPLLFPHGEKGFSDDIDFANLHNGLK
ncbi:uncharacterized protein LOC130732938 [Lotus japonicus]|uniref:uncharacterized protein LOC130732938 n=1 Tax=Lotus japonicus TaxID=34305 RepID=UPI0025869499|nr:uncharacterized protein LOC130732938 [Lotus japonicus]